MSERVRLRSESGGNYFTAPKTNIQFIKTGSTVLDLALGGGWAEGKIANIIGDKSTGKTLLCIEAAANFVKKYPNGIVRYREAEAAFDPEYAKALGMPVDSVDFDPERPLETVEDLFEDLEYCAQKAHKPELYIVDSLDALSSRAEMKRKIDEGTYGQEKAKLLSQLFRRLVREIEHKKITVIIVSQIRDKIGVTFGRKWTRSGGRALDFYTSQIVVLSQLGSVKKTINGVTRPIGISIKAKLEKNKISVAGREAEFDLIFGYGIDDEKSCANWLKEIKHKGSHQKDELQKVVQSEWYRIEREFLPAKGKYA